MEVSLQLKGDSHNTHTDGKKLKVEVTSESDEAQLTVDDRTITVSLSELMYALKQPR